MGNSPKMIFRHYRGKATQKETEEFYQIPSKLTLPTLAELISAGIPEGATDSELKKLKCPVDRHTTFALKKSEFEKARDAHLKAHPETAIPALRMPARTKRRMLDLPKEAVLDSADPPTGKDETCRMCNNGLGCQG
jgi:hypothetical protein